MGYYASSVCYLPDKSLEVLDIFGGILLYKQFVIYVRLLPCVVTVKSDRSLSMSIPWTLQILSLTRFLIRVLVKPDKESETHPNTAIIVQLSANKLFTVRFGNSWLI